jgi:large subunit ribosomal protein L21
MKYAIVESGGKQFTAVEGNTIEVDRLPAESGQQVTLDAVLLLVDGDKISVGAPVVEGAKVKATVVGHVKGPKVVIFKYRPKKHYRVKTGHRQQYTQLIVNSIETE